jgi:hypothetical protein
LTVEYWIAAVFNARPLASTLERTRSNIATAKIMIAAIRIATRTLFGIDPLIYKAVI